MDDTLPFATATDAVLPRWLDVVKEYACRAM